MIGTTGNLDILRDLQLADLFNGSIAVPPINGAKEAKKILSFQQAFNEAEMESALPMFDGKAVPVKQLLMIGEAVKRFETKEAKLKRLAQLLALVP